MRNIFVKIIALLLSVLMLTLACGCSNSNEETIGASTDLIDTGKLIVDEGKSSYQILIPVNADKNERLAAEELQLGIKACCGLELPVTTSYSSDYKFLSVGKTQLYSDNETEVIGEGLQRLESKVVTVGENVIMIGYTSEYSLYAAYDFMEKSFGFKWFTFEDYSVREAKSIKLYDFDFSNVAKMAYRNLFEFEYITIGDTFVKARRMRCYDCNSDGYTTGHAQSAIIPKSKYMAEHPEWFSRNDTWGTDPYSNGQLCLTNEEMIAEFIKNVKDMILEKYNAGQKGSFCNIAMADAFDPCQCKNCAAFAAELYGRPDNPLERAAIEIWFGNRVARSVNAWYSELTGGETLTFYMLAYFHNEQAPVKTLENGDVVVVDERAIPDDNLLLCFAPLGSDLTYSLNDDRSGTVKETLEKWFAFDSNIGIYEYATPYGAPMYPAQNLINMEGSYSWAIENGAAGYLDEGATQYNWPSMQKLKNYVMSQKWWGVEKTVDELALEFIDFYYEPVAEEFKTYYFDLKQFLTYQTEVLGKRYSVDDSRYGSTEFWPKGMVDHFDEQLIKMLDDIKYLETENPKQYQEFFDRINIERLWTNYSYLFNHSSYLILQKRNEIVDYLVKYMSKYNVCTNLISNVETKRSKQ